jgi:hypothetical protein
VIDYNRLTIELIDDNHRTVKVKQFVLTNVDAGRVAYVALEVPLAVLGDGRNVATLV